MKETHEGPFLGNGEKKMRKRMKAASIMLSIVISFSLLGCGEKESAYFLEEAVSASEEKNGAAAKMQDTKTQEEGQPFDQGVPDGESVAMQETEEGTFFVYVCGAVQNPGVYELGEGSRIFEAISLAGGFCEDACEEYVNQAQEIADAMKIYIPTREEMESGDFHGAEGNTGMEAQAQKEASSLININTADKEGLQCLPGIGESRAEAIIEYRESMGRFTKIEDIMQVSGIKEGAFQKIKDRICVE